MLSFRDDLELLHDYTRKRGALGQVLAELTEDGVRAQDVESDRTSGHDTVLFCWAHEQDPHDCHRQGFGCDGDPIPVATDPTGETTITPDRARRLSGELERAEARVMAAAGGFYDATPSTLGTAKQTAWIYLNHQAKKRRPDLEGQIGRAVEVLHRVSAEFFCTACTGPTPHPCERHSDLNEGDLQKAREKLGKVDRTRVCAFCGDEPGCTAKPTTVNGNLPHPRVVGRSCYDRIRFTGKPPTGSDLAHLKKHGKWPRIKEKAS